MCLASGCFCPATHIARFMGVDIPLCNGHFDIFHGASPDLAQEEPMKPTPSSEAPIALQEDLPGRPPIPFSDHEKALIKTLHEKGESSRSIAKVLGVSHDTVLRRVREMKKDQTEEASPALPSDLLGLLEAFRTWSDRMNMGEAKKKEGQRIVDDAKDRLRLIHQAMKPLLE